MPPRTEYPIIVPARDKLPPVSDIKIAPRKYALGLSDDEATAATTLLDRLLYGVKGDNASGILNLLLNTLGRETFESNFEFIERLYNLVHPLLAASLQPEDKPEDEEDITDDTPEDRREELNRIKQERSTRNDIKRRVNSVILREAMPMFIRKVLYRVFFQTEKHGNGERYVYDSEARESLASKRENLLERWRRRNHLPVVH
jgi:hypothetical protein